MAKTSDDLAKSREEREEVRKLLGCIPESILLHDKSDQATDLLVEEQGRDYTSTFHQPKNIATEFGKVTDEERNKANFYLSGAGARWGALSRFPQNVGRILLRLYSRAPYCSECGKSLDDCKCKEPKNRKVCYDTVVDPFAGHNSRMELCYRSRRNYIGCDISHKFMQANFKLREQLLEQNAADMFAGDNQATIELHECDSRKMEPVKNNIGDFTITCYDDKTEVLTDAGWKLFKDVTKNDSVATLNGDDIEYQHPLELQQSFYAGEMYRLKTPFVDLLVTPNHNLYVKPSSKDKYELRQARNMPRNFYLRADGRWHGAHVEQFTLPAVQDQGTVKSVHPTRVKKFKDALIKMDDFLEFFGYWLSEGSLNRGTQTYHSCVVLTTASDDDKNAFVDVCQRLGLNQPRVYNQKGVYRVRLHDVRLHDYLSQFGKAKDKFIPRDLLRLPTAQLQILFDALMRGDGSKSGDRYWTVSSRLKDDFMELCFKLGYVARATVSEPTEHVGPNATTITGRSPVWRIAIRREKTRPNISCCGWKQSTSCLMTWQRYSGFVYCVSVPNKVIYVRRNGATIWCGNSPPYWDLEYYGDEAEQLGKDNEYPEFLERLGKVAESNFRCLKSGAFCVWCVNDFRKDGKFYSYHSNTITLLRNAGFKLHDTAIIDLGGSFGQAFASQIIKNKILPKRHEYALIFRKP